MWNKLLIAVGLSLMTPSSAAAQSWSYPPGFTYQPQYFAGPRDRVHVRAHFRSRPHRSAESWKQSILSQGRAYCRAHPTDKICPR